MLLSIQNKGEKIESCALKSFLPVLSSFLRFFVIDLLSQGAEVCETITPYNADLPCAVITDFTILWWCDIFTLCVSL